VHTSAKPLDLLAARVCGAWREVPQVGRAIPAQLADLLDERTEGVRDLVQLPLLRREFTSCLDAFESLYDRCTAWTAGPFAPWLEAKLGAIAEFDAQLRADTGLRYELVISGLGREPARSVWSATRANHSTFVAFDYGALLWHDPSELRGPLAHEYAHRTTSNAWRLLLVAAAEALAYARREVSLEKAEALLDTCSALRLEEEFATDAEAVRLVGAEVVLEGLTRMERSNTRLSARLAEKGERLKLRPPSEAEVRWPRHPSWTQRVERVQRERRA
jgi:hypothetical protein